MSLEDYKFMIDAYFDMREYYRGILPDHKFFMHFVDCMCGHGRGIPTECIIAFLVGLGWTPEYIIECVGYKGI